MYLYEGNDQQLFASAMLGLIGLALIMMSMQFLAPEATHTRLAETREMMGSFVVRTVLILQKLVNRCWPLRAVPSLSMAAPSPLDNLMDRGYREC